MANHSVVTVHSSTNVVKQKFSGYPLISRLLHASFSGFKLDYKLHIFLFFVPVVLFWHNCVLAVIVI